MGTWVELATVGDVAEGAMKRLSIQGRDLLLARAGGNHYAADAVCPHMGADLSQGTLEGAVVTCPRHSSQFDLSDGRVLRWTDWSGLKLALARAIRPPRPLKVYKVRVEGERVMAEL